MKVSQIKIKAKKQILFIFSSILLTSCIGHYKDFDFKKKLSNDFYLAQSKMLPSKYICIAKDKHHLVIIDDIFNLYGNKEDVIISTLENESINKYYKINFNRVDYPEDVIEIDIDDFNKLKKKLSIEYSFNDADGFIKYDYP